MPEKTYYERWYEENGSVLNERRREKYAKDPGYRKRVLSRNSKSRQKIRRKAIEEKRAKVAAKKLRTDGSWKTVTRMEEVDGEEVEITYFSIGALAKILGKGISTVRVWEKQGILPETPHRSQKGDRLYTLQQVQTLQRKLRKAGRIEPAAAIRKKHRAPEPVTRKVRYEDGSVRATKLYQIGALASVVDRTSVWLKVLEKKKRLPETPLRKSSIGHRLYTVEMIEVVREAFRKHALHLRGNEMEWKIFREEILDGWSELGVENAQVIEVDDENKSNRRGKNSPGGGASRDANQAERVA